MKFTRNRLGFLSLFLIFLSAFNQQTAAQETARTRNFDAQHYVIRLSFVRQTKTVNGETSVVVKPLQDNFNSLVLDAANLQISSVTTEPEGKVLPFRINTDKLTIQLDRPYSQDETVQVRVKYTARPKRGVYFVEPILRQNNSRPAQIWTQGQPADNRHWFPSYDAPDDKATTEQFITTQPDEIAIGNGELVNVKTNSNGTKIFHFRMSQPFSTYLVSFVVGKFQKFSDRYNNVPLGFYLYPNRRDNEQVYSLAFGKTKKMLTVFEELTRYKYPFTKYDQTVVGNFQAFAGMENITATTLADGEIYGATEDGKLRDVENLVSHEIAHTWFGNMVTCESWSELWLNEGFATFMESVFIEREYGREAYLDEMRKNAAYYFFEEAAGIRHPLSNPRATASPLIFDSTTYKKGGFVVHMLRETVGDELFWKAINHYLNKHKFANVSTGDLQKAFEETTGKDLSWFFDQWTRKAGFPRLKIETSYDAADKKLKLLVRQTHKADSQTPAVFRLFADLEIRTANGSQTEKIEMTDREQIFTFDVAGKPIGILFDKREQILKKLEIAPLPD